MDKNQLKSKLERLAETEAEYGSEMIRFVVGNVSDYKNRYGCDSWIIQYVSDYLEMRYEKGKTTAPISL